VGWRFRAPSPKGSNGGLAGCDKFFWHWPMALALTAAVRHPSSPAIGCFAPNRLRP
jgi:hypothetical protein